MLLVGEDVRGKKDGRGRRGDGKEHLKYVNSEQLIATAPCRSRSMEVLSREGCSEYGRVGKM